jgi:hypothetical protein
MEVKFIIVAVSGWIVRKRTGIRQCLKSTLTITDFFLKKNSGAKKTM